MAGEFEDRLGIQAGTLRSGSVSFGRFESEPLSWERRSSFSCNRYLEEVEKCSTPGSVTQKKAYFEAHFKKKPLLNQASIESQIGTRCQTTQNGNEECKNYINVSEGFQGAEQLQLNSCVGKQATSDDYEDRVENGQEQISPSEIPIKCIPSVKDESPSSSFGLLDHEHRNLVQPKFRTVASEENFSDTTADQKSESEPKVLEECSEEVDSLSQRPIVEKSSDSDEVKKEENSEVKTTIQQKSAETKSKNELLSLQIPGRISTGKNSFSSGKHFIKTLKEMRDALRAKSEEKSPLAVPPATVCGFKTPKSEDSGSLKAKIQQAARSEKVQREKKGGAIAQSTSVKSKHIVNPAKPEVWQHKHTAAFSFRSDERAEKRKEFSMRMEEKFQAKEAERSEILARTQEEAEAEIKQLRKNLNFKATPMPSFYHGSMPRVSDRKKVITLPTKLTKLRSKNTTMSAGSTTSEEKKTHALSKSGNQESTCISGFRGSAQSDGPPTSEGDINYSNPAPKDRNQTSKPSKKTEAGQKEKSEPTSQQQQVEEKTKKVTKDDNLARGGPKKDEMMGKMIMSVAGGNFAVHSSS